MARVGPQRHRKRSFILKVLIMLIVGWSDSTDFCELPLLKRSVFFFLVVCPVPVKEMPSANSCNEQCNIRLFRSNRLSSSRSIFFFLTEELLSTLRQN